MQETLIGQRYRLTEKIGTGGMADVYRAVDETLGRNVAVKIMHERYAHDPAFTARFRQEAQAAANLSSPYIVNIYDWGQEGDVYYIVMELVRGTDLKTIIRERGPLPSKEVAEIGAQVCSALATAHGYDVIHRDIKPHNIMITADRNVKVMDFGIARAGNTTLTQTGSVLGSAHYVSPEQAQGRQLTPASDLYSLGIVLYEAATGKMPFDGDTPIATALKQVNEQPVRPSRINPKIDPNLEMVIGYAMAKDPRSRYSTASTMRADLVRIVRDEPIVGAGAVAAGAAVGAGALGAAAGAAAAGIGNSDETQLLGRVPASDAMGAGASGQQTTVMPQLDPYAGNATSGVRSGDLGDQQFNKKKSKAWIWIIVAVILLAGILAAGFALGWFGGSGQKTVPDLTGRTVAEATTMLNDQDLGLGAQTEDYSPTVPKGQIMKQDPAANKKVAPQSKVDVVVSLGQQMITVPDVSKMDQATATKTLEDAGFVVQSDDPANSPDVPAGKVMSQNPAANTEAAKGSTVHIVISLGQEMGTVPDVRGQTQAQAQSLLTSNGFKVNVQQDFSDTVNSGVVISQSIPANTTTPKGTTVTITVSKGANTIAIPNVISMQWQAAIQKITAAGLVCDPTRDIVWAGTDMTGNVVQVSPAVGSQVAKGSHVVLTVDEAKPTATP
ncbi:MAG: Stk1 family PASTA domain-containing Ser/Thr kinase [Coriobacteriia bacterium]|nr:Stk1 family PASTA domain-containing Ser/Thr kinase [Coriobacteriia bacterium]